MSFLASRAIFSLKLSKMQSFVEKEKSLNLETKMLYCGFLKWNSKILLLYWKSRLSNYWNWNIWSKIWHQKFSIWVLFDCGFIKLLRSWKSATLNLWKANFQPIQWNLMVSFGLVFTKCPESIIPECLEVHVRFLKFILIKTFKLNYWFGK